MLRRPHGYRGAGGPGKEGGAPGGGGRDWLRIALVVLPTILLLRWVLVLGSGGGAPVEVDAFVTCEPGVDTGCDLRVPRIIHQTYKSLDSLPERWRGSPHAWNSTHPGYTYMFWSDEANRRFLEEHYAWFLPQYDRYPNMIQRVDAVRYFLLHHYGGVYVDLDVQPLRSIEPLLYGADVVLPETPNLGLTNAFMAAAKRTDFMGEVIHSLEGAADRWFHVVRHVQIVTSTGPAFIWKQKLQYRGPSQIRVIPSGVWGKCAICETVCAVRPHGYFHHVHGDSWHHWDSFVINYVLFCHPYTCLAVAALLAMLVRHRGRLDALREWVDLRRREVAFCFGTLFLLMLVG